MRVDELLKARWLPSAELLSAVSSSFHAASSPADETSYIAKTFLSASSYM